MRTGQVFCFTVDNHNIGNRFSQRLAKRSLFCTQKILSYTRQPFQMNIIEMHNMLLCKPQKFNSRNMQPPSIATETRNKNIKDKKCCYNICLNFCLPSIWMHRPLVCCRRKRNYNAKINFIGTKRNQKNEYTSRRSVRPKLSLKKFIYFTLLLIIIVTSWRFLGIIFPKTN